MGNILCEVVTIFVLFSKRKNYFRYRQLGLMVQPNLSDFNF